MGLFKQKKDEEAKIQLERESLDRLNNKDNNLFDISLFYTEEELSLKGNIKAPHTITADELNGKLQNTKAEKSDSFTEEIPMQKDDDANTSPTGFLYQRMMQFRENPQHPPVETIEKKAESSNEVKVDEVVPTTEKAKEESSNNENSTETQDKSKLNVSAEERRVTLLARCNAFLEDAHDSYKFNTEKYKLESVESILESFEARAAERINKKFNLNSQAPETKAPAKVDVDTPSAVETSTISFTLPENITVPTSTPSLSDTVVFGAPETNKILSSDENQQNEVKHIFTANTEITPKTKSIDVDDLSSTKVISDISSHSNPNDVFSSSKTAVFPIVEPIIKEAQREELAQNTETDKETQKPIIDDYKTIADRTRILNSLVQKKKSFNIRLLVSFVCFIGSIIFTSPISTSFSLSKSSINIIDLIICLLVLVSNVGALSGVKFLFNPKAKNSLPAALSLISAIFFSLINIIFNGSLFGLSSLAAMSLISYNLANKNFYSHTIKNFNLIANSEFKNTVSIIQNKNATKTIVGNSIDGSALVCYGGETTNVRNFLKYTFSESPISNKIQKMSLISLIFAFILSAVAFVLKPADFIFPIYIFCTSVCFCALPAVFHIVSLTINSANKRLNHYSAMITGYQAADELELCNAVAISCDSLFPEGTIRLVDMKLLSPNPFDQSMLDAAAICSSIHSPLAGIFNQMDASKNYTAAAQEVDTVIYEEKMGISGWVNDRRVFVGNRDLLIAHGFTNLPPAELDKKIMRKGYFPVYIASDNITCALLVVKYEPDYDILYEIQRLANTGTTILVDNCDPNINSQMLTDYFELYNDTIFVMSKHGSDFYKASVQHKEHRSSGAVFKSKIEGLIAALTASINIKKYISRMTVFYITSVVLGLLLIFAALFMSLTNYISPIFILLAQLALSSATLLPTILRKP